MCFVIVRKEAAWIGPVESKTEQRFFGPLSRHRLEIPTMLSFLLVELAFPGEFVFISSQFTALLRLIPSDNETTGKTDEDPMTVQTRVHVAVNNAAFVESSIVEPS